MLGPVLSVLHPLTHLISTNSPETWIFCEWNTFSDELQGCTLVAIVTEVWNYTSNFRMHHRRFAPLFYIHMKIATVWGLPPGDSCHWCYWLPPLKVDILESRPLKYYTAPQSTWAETHQPQRFLKHAKTYELKGTKLVYGGRGGFGFNSVVKCLQLGWYMAENSVLAWVLNINLSLQQAGVNQQPLKLPWFLLRLFGSTDGSQKSLASSQPPFEKELCLKMSLARGWNCFIRTLHKAL